MLIQTRSPEQHQVNIRLYYAFKKSNEMLILVHILFPFASRIFRRSVFVCFSHVLFRRRVVTLKDIDVYKQP